MLELMLIELAKRVESVKTLSTQKENKIVKVDIKEIYVETESSRDKYEKGEKREPFEILTLEFIKVAWQEFIEVRQASAYDFKKTRGRSSFLMGLLSLLPFVEIFNIERATTIKLKEFQTDELPNEQYVKVKDFLQEVISGKYDPKNLSKQIDGNLYRVKARARQDCRLLGLVNEFNEVNKPLLETYINANNKDTFIGELLLEHGYFRLALSCLDLLRELTKNEKRLALEELGMLIVRNSRGENLMVESVAKERTHNLIIWLESTGLIDQEWRPIENYFNTFQTREKEMSSNIKANFLRIMNEYLPAKREGFGGHPLGTFVRNDIPKDLLNLSFVNPEKYVVTGSVGQGNWASVPWIAIMNRNITVSTQRGYYIVYLFSEDMKRVYLTLAQGVTETSKKEMLRIKEEIRESITASEKVRKDDDIELGNSTKARQYAMSTAAYIPYESDSMPDEAVLVDDLEEMVQIYEDYIAFKEGVPVEREEYKGTETAKGNTSRENNSDYITYKELVNHIDSYIKSKGFYYTKVEIINLFLSLKTKPFVILSGISGTGKTKIVQWLAESVGANEDNGQFTLIPIRPDWNDGSDLLGYVDIKGDFKEGPLTKVVKRAEQNPKLPYFVLLDEMNLARVEHYFSDILSVMESRKWENGQIVSSNLLTEETAGVNLKLPTNLYIIGTVNMDETTHPFSKKVLDRANTIEFNRVALDNLAFLEELKPVDPIPISHEKLSSNYLHLKDVYGQHKELVEAATNELVKMNEALQLINAHVGYRVRDEICFYLANNEEGGLLDYKSAIDHCILQKVLPRVAGSDSRVDELLRALYRIFTNKEALDDIENNQADLETAKYPRSAEKVLEMLRRLRDDGFTSFWVS